MNVKIGETELGPTPRIAVSLTDRDAHQAAEAQRWADVVELRVDMFAARRPRDVATICENVRRSRAPLLVTVRSDDQGGAHHIDDESRLALYAAALPFADAFDIELRSTICDDVIALAAQRSITTIASHHDFVATPSERDLRDLVTEAGERGADIVKVATTAALASHRTRLLDLLRDERERAMIVIAMGPYGAASRVFFPLCGSLLTYGFLHEAVAPGQMSIRELHRELTRYCPDFGAARG